MLFENKGQGIGGLFPGEKPARVAAFPPGARVLVAEDSLTIRGYLRRTVQALIEQPAIVEVADGAKALEEVASRPVDLLITDLQMPLMTGREFLREAFKKGHLSGAVVLVISSSITLGLRDEFSLRANVVFLRKPATAEDIKDAILKMAALL